MKAIFAALILFSSIALATFYQTPYGSVNQSTVITNAGTTTTLGATANQVYIHEGSALGQTVKLPAATSLPNDWWYEAFNNSSGTVTYSNNSSTTIKELGVGRAVRIILKDNSTAAGTWKSYSPASISEIITDHGGLTGLSDDDHTQYHNDTRGDARYYTKSEFLDLSAGAADSGKPIKLNASGLVDSTMLPSGFTGITGLGTYDFQTQNPAGASVSGSSIIMQSATAAYPGLVSTSSQIFAGAKQFNNAINLQSVTASMPIKSDASKNIVSDRIQLSDTTNDVAGVLGRPNGGTGLSTAPANGEILIGNGTGYSLATITAGSNISVTNGAGSIVITGSPSVNIGSLDSQTKDTRGVTASSGVIYMQTADPVYPGIVSTSAQSFAGPKTFLGNVTSSQVYGSTAVSGSLTLRSTTNATPGSVVIADQTSESWRAGPTGSATTFNGVHELLSPNTSGAQNGLVVRENSKAAFNAASGTNNANGWAILPRGPSGAPEIRVSTNSGSGPAYIRPYDSGLGGLYGYFLIGPNWGFQNSNAGIVTLYVGGTTGQTADLLRFSKTTDFASTDGSIGPNAEFRAPTRTAALPGFAFQGDTNNGWWSPSADVQAWSLSGAEAMRLSNNQLGINTPTPTANLDVSGSARIRTLVTASAVVSADSNGYLSSKSLTAGTNITVTQTATDITVSGSAGAGTFLGAVKWPATTSCDWARTSNNSFADFSADADCTLPTGSNIIGSRVSAPASKIPGIVLSGVDTAKTYQIIVNGPLTNETASINCIWRLNDGTDSSFNNAWSSDLQDKYGPSQVFTMKFTNANSRTVNIQGTGNNGSGACGIEAGATLKDLTLSVYEF